MRIALVVPGFSASETDWCIPALLTLVRRLTARVDVEIFALRYPAPPRTYQVAGARVEALGGGQIARWGKVGLLRRTLGRVIAAHRRQPFDAVHALWADEPGAVATLAARWMGRPAIVSVMGGELVRMPEQAYGTGRSLAGRTLVRLALRDAAVVTAGSTTLAQTLPPAVKEKLRVVPLGVDTERFKSADLLTSCGPPLLASCGLLAGQFRILHVASLSPVKDHALMIAAMIDIARMEGTHLHLVGDGPLRASLEARVAAAGLEQRVTFHGEVPHDRLPAFYQAADVCVVTSLHESQSMVALEACACGRPVVGTPVGILPDLQKAARVVPPGDPAALARALLDLAGDPAARLEMGECARRLAEDAFTVERTVDTWIDIYTSAIRSRSGAPSRS